MNNQKVQTEQNKSNTLFVANLPKDTTFDDLSDFFQKYHFQYATLNNSKSTNVWAQVFLEDGNWAKKARHELNGEILKPKLSQDKGKPISICKFEGKNSLNKEKKINQNLLVKNIDINMSLKEFYNIFLKYGDVESAKIEYDENGNSKGYGYIYYSNENEAEEAKKNLNGKEFYGKTLNIVNLVPSNNQGRNLTLFVINFPLYFNDIDLRKLFEKYGNIKYASVSKDERGISKGIGFITFSNFEETSKCISDIKHNQIVFPNLPPLCVKYATKKEDREKRANFTSNNYSNDEYKIRFNLRYSLYEIRNEYDLEKAIRLFIKVVMLQEYSPKEVLVDLNSNSGIVTLSKLKEFELFMQKYNEFCMQREPEFQCIPISFEENINQYSNQNNMNVKERGMNQYINNYNNLANMDAPLPENYNNMNQNFMNNSSPQNYQQINQENRNNLFPNVILTNERDNFQLNNQAPNNSNYHNYPIPQNPNMIFLNQTNPNFQYQNNNNIKRRNNNNLNFMNINNNNINTNFPKNQNINMIRFPNYQQQNLLAQQQSRIMMMMQNKMGNYPQNIPQMGNSLQSIPFIYNQQRKNIYMKNQNDKIEELDERNLQNLNPSQLQSQFKDPTILVFNREMIDNNEEISNEIADSIYEIVYNIHPVEAAKITGMIKEMGIEKMNMLLSKNEDLKELIEKAYDMIKKGNFNQ